VILECIAELASGVIYLLSMYEKITLEHIYYVYAIKHILLFVDYLYTSCKGPFYLNDVLFGIGNIMFYANLAVNTRFKDTNSYLYITAIAKSCLDILLYSTTVAFRVNPVRLWLEIQTNNFSISVATSKRFSSIFSTCY